jgi:hypothetical protein
LWGTPQLQNAALGAFHARLFLGPESLAAETPRSQLAPAMLALLPLAGRGFWAAGGAWRTFLALAVAGYLLAGTSVPALATAAAPILSAWPPLASAPVLGLALATLLLALVVTPRGWRR